MQKKQSNSLVIVAYSISTLLWASAFVGIRVGLEAYTPEHLSLLRLVIASLLLAILGFIFHIRRPEIKDIPVILLLGGLGFTTYHTALNYGEQTIIAGVSSLIVSTTPIFTSLLALIFFRERFGIRGWIGTMLGFLGVALISFGMGNTLQLNSGLFLILLASFSESVYFTFQKPYVEKYGFFTFTSYTIWAGTFCMLVFLPGLREEILHAQTDVTLSVLYLGIFPTVLPYLALAFVTSRVWASEATSSLYVTPVLAFIIDWIWLGEVPTLISVVGGIITIFGVVIANIQVSNIQVKQ